MNMRMSPAWRVRRPLVPLNSTHFLKSLRKSCGFGFYFSPIYAFFGLPTLLDTISSLRSPSPPLVFFSKTCPYRERRCRTALSCAPPGFPIPTSLFPDSFFFLSRAQDRSSTECPVRTPFFYRFAPFTFSMQTGDRMLESESSLLSALVCVSPPPFLHAWVSGVALINLVPRLARPAAV